MKMGLRLVVGMNIAKALRQHAAKLEALADRALTKEAAERYRKQANSFYGLADRSEWLDGQVSPFAQGGTGLRPAIDGAVNGESTNAAGHAAPVRIKRKTSSRPLSVQRSPPPSTGSSKSSLFITSVMRDGHAIGKTA